ncbi:hypothetical protein cypCar_00024398 [Cyprinus carpio]|nr:hypothetical protein cypCar_00024398 [Cyprinus carpio]
MRQHANDPVDPSAQNADDDAAVQTILLVQESASSSPSSSSSAMPVVQEGMLVAEEGSSSVVFLHPNLTMPTITVPTITVPSINVVAGQDVPHTIEFRKIGMVLSNARARDSDEEILRCDAPAVLFASTDLGAAITRSASIPELSHITSHIHTIIRYYRKIMLVLSASVPTKKMNGNDIVAYLE